MVEVSEVNSVNVRQAGMSRVMALVGLLLLSVALLVHEFYYDYVADDAFISFRYVLNFVEGNGLVYNVGERVEGYTNFLWIIVLSLPASIGLDPVVVSRLLGAALSLATVIALFSFMKVRCGTGWMGSLLAPALLAANAAYVVWAMSGMETLLFTFLVFISYWRFVSEWDAERPLPLSALLFALAALARPEAILFFLISAVLKCGRDVIVRRRICRETLVWLSIFVAVFLPYFIWRLNYYGWLLPNTFYAKVGGGYLVYIRGMFYTVKFVSAFGGLLVFALPVAIFLKRRIQFWASYAWILLASFVAYILYVGGDGLVISRFFVPVLPLVYVLVAAGFLQLISGIAGSNVGPRRTHVIAWFMAAVLIVGTLNASYNIRRDPYSQVVADRELVRNLAEIGRWLKVNTSPGETLAVYTAGAVPYYSGLYTIDMLGLTDEHIAHTTNPNMGNNSAGHEKRDWNYVLSRRPNYIINGWPTPSQSSAQAMILSDSEEYVFRSVRIGEGMYWSNFALQKGELWFNYYELSSRP